MAVEVEFTIETDGTPTVAVKGAKGKTCIDMTRDAESAFGEVKERTKTREYNERPVNVGNANTNKA